MKELVCPGCGDNTSIEGLEVGDRIDCPNCADLTLRVSKPSTELLLEAIFKVSCPSCERLMEVPAGAAAGDRLHCCGKEFRLTYEFGAYALR